MLRAALVAFVSLVLVGSAVAGARSVSWVGSLDDALKAAQDAKKPVLIYFMCPSDAACKKFEEKVLGDNRVVEQSRKFVCVKIDCDKDDTVAKEYGVDSWPAVVFAKENGDKIANLESRDPEKVAEQLSGVAENYGK